MAIKDKNDEIGKKYNRLLIKDIVQNPPTQHTWVTCLCDCGRVKDYRLTTLKTERTKSCGCLSVEIHIKRNTTHGKTKMKAYQVWLDIRRRCYKDNFKHFKHYGGRGIEMSDEWLNSVDNFIRDMGEPLPGMEIERLDNDKNYCVENCIWASRHQQTRNTRRTRNYTIGGQTKCLQDWCKIYGISFGAANSRLKLGWDIVDALSTSVRYKSKPKT